MSMASSETHGWCLWRQKLIFSVSQGTVVHRLNTTQFREILCGAVIASLSSKLTISLTTCWLNPLNWTRDEWPRMAMLLLILAALMWHALAIMPTSFICIGPPSTSSRMQPESRTLTMRMTFHRCSTTLAGAFGLRCQNSAPMCCFSPWMLLSLHPRIASTTWLQTTPTQIRCDGP